MLPKFSFIVLCLFSFSLTILSQTVQPTPPIDDDKDIIRIDSKLVQLDFMVLDKDGQQVKNLTTDDIEVYQDGKLQKVSNFSYVDFANQDVSQIVKPEKPNKNAVPVPPAITRTQAQGRLLTFVVDDGNCKSSLGGINTSKDTLTKFVNEQMLPNDRVAIYQTKGGSSLIRQYTSNKEQLLRTIGKIKLSFQGPSCGKGFSDSVEVLSGKSSIEAALIKTNSENQKKINDASDGSQAVGSIGVLNYVVERLKPVSGRKTVFFLSEGLPAFRESRAKEALNLLSDNALRSSVVFYTVDVRGSTNPALIDAGSYIEGIAKKEGEQVTEKIYTEKSESLRTSREGLADLAYATGGDFIKEQNFPDKAVKNSIDRESGYYLVAYDPEDEVFKGKEFHKIEIKLKKPELKLFSRNGFFGIENTKPKVNNKTADSPLYQAIASPFSENGMEMRLTTIFENDVAKGNAVRTLLQINGKDLTFVDQPNGMKKLSIDVVAETLDEKSRVVDGFSRTHTLKVSSDAIPYILENGLIFTTDVPIKKNGSYNFRIVVRDNASGKLASTGEVLEIPNLDKNDFFMSGLITAEISPDGSFKFPIAATAEQAISVPLNSTNSAIRKFRAGDSIRYAYNIFNAKNNNLTAQLRLYNQGTLVTESKESPIQVTDLKRIKSSGSFGITRQVQAGEYVLQIVVRDKTSNKTTSQWIDFEVVN
jgi:VWFA-related protein